MKVSSRPVVYLLHGDDEHAMQRFVQRMEEKLGDPATAQLNLTVLERENFSLGALASAAQAMPFLAERRLVVVHDPLAALASSQQREKFTALLENLPESTALVLLIHQRLQPSHWLLRWAATQGERVFIRALNRPQGAQLTAWIRAQAAERDGAITPTAAQLLAEAVGADPHQLIQEVEKLLAYVNYARPIDEEDVMLLVSGRVEGDIFALVDAVGNQNARQALKRLRVMLELEHPLRIFAMIIRQFRLLLLTRELMDNGATADEIAAALKVQPFLAPRLIAQARRYTLASLEHIYRRLAEIDAAIKSGQVEAEVALETLVAALTA
ncbi:MAG: DNA polymerase III subunit delta [Anaerolineae bacterium]|nr:MAG: DNA polymerase III subunit delta [Anaerolineae bacterium]